MRRRPFHPYSENYIHTQRPATTSATGEAADAAAAEPLAEMRRSGSSRGSARARGRSGMLSSGWRRWGGGETAKADLILRGHRLGSTRKVRFSKEPMMWRWES